MAGLSTFKKMWVSAEEYQEGESHSPSFQPHLPGRADPKRSSQIPISSSRSHRHLPLALHSQSFVVIYPSPFLVFLPSRNPIPTFPFPLIGLTCLIHLYRSLTSSSLLSFNCPDFPRFPSPRLNLFSLSLLSFSHYVHRTCQQQRKYTLTQTMTATTVIHLHLPSHLPVHQVTIPHTSTRTPPQTRSQRMNIKMSTVMTKTQGTARRGSPNELEISGCWRNTRSTLLLILELQSGSARNLD